MGGVCRAKGRGRLRPLNIIFLYNQTSITQRERGDERAGEGAHSDKHFNLHQAVYLTVNACVVFVRFCPCFRDDGGRT